MYSEGCTGEILAEFLQNLSDNKNEYEFFTQDGAPAHQSNNPIIMLRNILRDRIIYPSFRTCTFNRSEATRLFLVEDFERQCILGQIHKNTQTKAHDELKSRASNRNFLDKNFNSLQ